MGKIRFFTNVGLFLVFVVSSLVLISCEKEADPVPDPVYYTVKTSVVGLGGNISPLGETRVLKGSTLLLTVTVNPGFRTDSILVDGVKKPLTDHKYYLKNINADYTVEVKFKTDYAYILEQHGWKLEGISQQYDKIWYYTQWWGISEQSQYIWYFLPNGKTAVYLDNTNNLVGDMAWYLDQNVDPMVIHIGVTSTFPEGTPYVIEKLDGDSLIYIDYNSINLDDPSNPIPCKWVYSKF